MTLPATVSHAVQQTQEWLRELRDNGDLADENEAYSVLRSVLHQLRDRLTVEEAVDLGAQLPLIVRGIYFEGWEPRHVPEKVRTRQKFLDGVTMKLLPHRNPPEPAVRDVFALRIIAIPARSPTSLRSFPASSRSCGLKAQGASSKEAVEERQPVRNVSLTLRSLPHVGSPDVLRLPDFASD
jgi:uncharacterized protein (DUF2267 family)